MELEEKVRLLKEEFSSLPNILIKQTLCSGDINGDLEKCKQQLQKFHQINTSSLSSPLADTKPLTTVRDKSQIESVNNYKAKNRSLHRNVDAELLTVLQARKHKNKKRPSSGGLSSPLNTRSDSVNPSASNTATAFAAKQRYLDNCHVKPTFPVPRVEVSDPAKMTANNQATIAKPEERMVPDLCEPETKPNVVSNNSHSSNEPVVDPVTIQMQKGEMVSAVKSNSPSAPKPKPKPTPHWLTKQEKKQDLRDEDFKRTERQTFYLQNQLWEAQRREESLRNELIQLRKYDEKLKMRLWEMQRQLRDWLQKREENLERQLWEMQQREENWKRQPWQKVDHDSTVFHQDLV